MSRSVGLIANPASGRDVRRLVAHASVFTTQEKIDLLRRVLLGLAAAGVRRVLYMPDPQRPVLRAFEPLDLPLELAPAAAAARGDAVDTTEAARRMSEAGVGAIVSLGGDGTQRALARGSCDVPLVPVSTGTNNVPRCWRSTASARQRSRPARG
jgi:predicted polyphosphate/ATP-dependent NAD kinase